MDNTQRIQQEQEAEKQRPMEEHPLNYTNQWWVQVMFCLGLILIVIIRKRIGVRVLRVDLIVAATLALLFIAFLSDFLNKAPLLNANIDFFALLVFTGVFAVSAVYKTVRAHIDVARGIPFQYTRYQGDSYLYAPYLQLVKWINNTWINTYVRSQARFQQFVEPALLFIAARLVWYFIAPNLGMLLTLMTTGVFVVEMILLGNAHMLKYDQNDAYLLNQAFQQNMEEVKEDDMDRSVLAKSAGIEPSKHVEPDTFI